MGRGKQKEHGDPKDKFFVGIPNGDTIILEDTTTTGSSLINTIIQLKECKKLSLDDPVLKAFKSID